MDASRGAALQDAMFEAASETLENMAFMEVIPQKERRDEVKYYSRLDILTPVKGSLTLVTTPQLAREITEGIIESEDGPPPEEMVFDTLAEIINTIAGRLMRVLTPENETFSLGLPDSFSSTDYEFDKTAEYARYLIDGQSFLVVAAGEELLQFAGTVQAAE